MVCTRKIEKLTRKIRTTTFCSFMVNLNSSMALYDSYEELSQYQNNKKINKNKNDQS